MVYDIFTGVASDKHKAMNHATGPCDNRSQ
jgi:hypothetical protein